MTDPIVYDYLVNETGYTPATEGKKFIFNETEYKVGDTAVATLGDAIGYQANTAVFSGAYSYGNNAVITGAGSVMDITAGVLTVSGSDPYTADVTSYANTSVTFAADKKVTNKGTLNLTGHYTPATTSAEAVTNWVTFTNDSFINNENAIVNLTYAKFLSNNAQAQVAVTNTNGTFNITNSVVKAHFAGGEINIQGTFDANTKITGNAAISATKTLTLNGATLEGGSLDAASINLTNSTLTIIGTATHSWIYASGTNTIKATAVGEGSKYVALSTGAILQESDYAGKVRANSKVQNNESVYLYGANTFATLSTNRAIVKIGDADHKTTVKVGQLDFERYKLDDDSYEFGKVDVDFRSTLTVTTKVTKYNGCNLNISIDGLGTTGNDNALYKVVDITGATKVSPLINILTVGGNVLADGAAVGDTGYYLATIGDTGVYLTTETQTTIFVGADYTAAKTGTLVNGHLVGYNAFDTLDAALKEAAKAKSTTITIQNAIAPETAVAETVTANFTESLTLGGAKSATITFSGKNDLILSMAAEKTFTLAADTTLKTLGYDGYIVLSGAGSYDIFGTVDSVSQVAFWGDAEVKSTGKIVSKYTRPNTGMVLFRSAKNGSEGVTITGAQNQTTKLVQVDTSVAFLVDGKLSTSDTAINATLVDFTQNLNEVGDPMWASEVIDTTGTTPVAKPGAKFVLDSKDTDWTIGTLDASGEKAKITGEFNFSGGTVDVAGNADLGATVTLNLTDDAEMTVGGTLTNRYGTINVGNAADTDKGIAPSSATLSATIIDNYGKINVYNSAISTAVSDNFRNYVANSELNLHKSTFTGSAITNGGKVVVDDSSVQVRYLNAGTNFTVEGTSTLKSTIKATGSITLADDATLVGTDLVSSAAFSLSIAEDSTFTFAGENTISVENSTLINAGTLIVSEKAAVGTQGEEGYQAAVPGALTVGTIENTGTITVNAGSSISAKSIAGENGNIVLAGIDETKASQTLISTTAGVIGTFKYGNEITLTEAGVAHTADNKYWFTRTANDITLDIVNNSQSTLLVNQAWKDLADGSVVTITEGTYAGKYVIGFNAFGKFTRALTIAAGLTPEDDTTTTDVDEGKTTIAVLSNIEETPTDYLANVKSNILVQGNANIGLAFGDGDFELSPIDPAVASPSITIDSGIKLTITGNEWWGYAHLGRSKTTPTLPMSFNLNGGLDSNVVIFYNTTSVSAAQENELPGTVRASQIYFQSSVLDSDNKEVARVVTVRGDNQFGPVPNSDPAVTNYQVVSTGNMMFMTGILKTFDTYVKVATSLSLGNDGYLNQSNRSFTLNSNHTTWDVGGLFSTAVRDHSNPEKAAIYGHTDETYHGTLNFTNGSLLEVGGNAYIGRPEESDVTAGYEGRKTEFFFTGSVMHVHGYVIVADNGSSISLDGLTAALNVDDNITNNGTITAVNGAEISAVFAVTNSGTITLGNAAVEAVEAVEQVGEPGDPDYVAPVAAVEGKAASKANLFAGSIVNNAGATIESFGSDGARSTITTTGDFNNSGVLNINNTNLTVKGNWFAAQNGSVATITDSEVNAAFNVQAGGKFTLVNTTVRKNSDNGKVRSITNNEWGTFSVTGSEIYVETLSNSSAKRSFTATNSDIDADTITNSGTFEATNTAITFGDGDNAFVNNGTFTMIGGSVSGSSVSTADADDKFVVSGTATLNIGALTGRINVLDGAALTATISPANEAVGAVQFNAATGTTTAGITIADGSAITAIINNYNANLQAAGALTAGAIWNKSDDAKITVKGALTAGAITNQGTIVIDANGSISAASVNGGLVTINAAGAVASTDPIALTVGEAGITAATIDLIVSAETLAGSTASYQFVNGTVGLTGDNAVTLKVNGTTYVENQVIGESNYILTTKGGTGLWMVQKAPTPVLSVSSAYTPATDGWNISKFASLVLALKGIQPDTDSLVVEEGYAPETPETLTDNLTVTFADNAAISGKAFTLAGDEDAYKENLILRAADGKTLTIGNNITLNNANIVLNNGKQSTAIVSGNLKGNEVQIDGNATVTGTLTADTLLWLRNGKSVATPGAKGNAITLSKAVSAETVLISSGKVAMTTADADVSGTSLIIGPVDDTTAAVSIVSDGADWTFTSNMLATGTNADSFTLNGGLITFAGTAASSIKITNPVVHNSTENPVLAGTALIENANFTLTLNSGAKLNAKTIDNIGKIIMVDGSATEINATAIVNRASAEVPIPAQKAIINAKNITAGSIENYGTIGNLEVENQKIAKLDVGTLTNKQYGGVFATALEADSIENSGEIVVKTLTITSADGLIDNKAGGKIAQDNEAMTIDAKAINNVGYISTHGGAITATAITNGAYDAETNDGVIAAGNVTAGGSITNNGKIEVTNAISAVDSGTTKAITNAAGATILAASITAGKAAAGNDPEVAGSISNAGTIGAYDAANADKCVNVDITAYGTVSNTGTIYAGNLTAARIENSAGSLTITGKATVTGNVVVTGGQVNFKNGSVSAGLLVTHAGDINATAADLTGRTLDIRNGNFNVYGATTLKNVSLTNGAGSTMKNGKLILNGVDLTGATVTADNSYSGNNGAIIVNNNGTTASTFSGVNSFATLTVEGGLTIKAEAAECLVVNGNFANNGAITINVLSDDIFGASNIAKIVSVTGTLENAGSITANEGYQVLVKNDGADKGIYVLKGGSSDIETIVVSSAWATDVNPGDTVYYDGTPYTFTLDAFRNASEITNLTAATKTLKFTSIGATVDAGLGPGTYGALTLNNSIDVIVNQTSQTGTGDRVAFTKTTITDTVETETPVPTVVTMTVNNAILGALSVSGSTATFNAATVTADSASIKDSTVNFGGSSLGLAVNFAGATTVAGTVTLDNSTVNLDSSITAAELVMKNAAIINANGKSVKATTSTSMNSGSIINAKSLNEFDILNKQANTGADVKLGAFSGNGGTINTDWNSLLTFTGFAAAAGTGFALNVDVTGFEGGTDTLIVGGVNGMTYGATEAAITLGADYSKYFKVGEGTNVGKLYVRAEARNVTYVNSGDANDLKTKVNYTWSDLATPTTKYHTDNLVVTGGTYEGELTKFDGTGETGADISDKTGTAFNGVNTYIQTGSTFNAARISGGKIAHTSEADKDKCKAWDDTEGTYNLTINGGTFNGVLIGGNRVISGNSEHVGKINLTINGGNFKTVIAGMMYDNANSSRGKADLTAGADGVAVNLTITAGDFTKDGTVGNTHVYGGSGSRKNAFGACSTIYGDVNVTLDVQGEIKLNTLFVGSMGKGVIEGNTKLTLTGGTGTLSAHQLWGGCDGDRYDTSASKAYNGSVVGKNGNGGHRTLSFEGFNGSLANVSSIKMFSDVIIESTVNFTGFNGTLAEVENWEIAYGSDNIGAFNNDFTGDTLKLTGLANMAVDEETGIGTWTIFDNVSKFAADDSGNKLAFANVSYDDTTASYALSIETINDKDAMVLTKTVQLA